MKQKAHILPMFLGLALFPVRGFASEAGKAGLPQMDVTFFVGQLFWLAVFFAILFLLMRFLALPPVQQTQEKREQILGGDMNAAKKAQEDVQTLMSDYEKKLAAARSKAQEVIGQTTKTSVNEFAVRQTDHLKEWGERILASEAKIAEAKEKALVHVRESVDDLAQSILSKVTGASFGSRREG